MLVPMTDRAKRFLKLAKQIADGKVSFISPYNKPPVITKADYMSLVQFSGELELFFEDDMYNGTTDSDHRLLFLCMAATR